LIDDTTLLFTSTSRAQKTSIARETYNIANSQISTQAFEKKPNRLVLLLLNFAVTHLFVDKRYLICKL
jgi:hypothetical protein